MSIKELPDFIPVGTHRPDGVNLVAWDARSGAPGYSSVIYVFVLGGRIVYFGESGRSAEERNRELANHTRRTVSRGWPLSGAAWLYYDALESGAVVTVYTGPALGRMSRSERRLLERRYMLQFNTIYPHGWNNYCLPQ